MLLEFTFIIRYADQEFENLKILLLKGTDVYSGRSDGSFGGSGALVVDSAF